MLITESVIDNTLQVVNNFHNAYPLNIIIIDHNASYFP